MPMKKRALPYRGGAFSLLAGIVWSSGCIINILIAQENKDF
jgi:hypothetical protein